MVWTNKTKPGRIHRDFDEITKQIYGEMMSLAKRTKKAQEDLLNYQIMRNKKGTILDVLYVVIAFVVIGMIILTVAKISGEINTQIQDSPLLEEKGKSAASKLNNHFYNVVDNSVLFLLVGMSIVALALAAMVRVNPVFFVIFIIILVIITIIAGMFSNIYLEMANNPEYQTVANQLVFTTEVISNLPMIIGVIGFILGGIMFKSWRQNQIF